MEKKFLKKHLFRVIGFFYVVETKTKNSLVWTEI